jgi:hypothetical protein
MSSYFYKSSTPKTVAIVRDFYSCKDAQLEAMKRLGEHFGGTVAPMRDITSHFAGGVKLSSRRELDVHWRRPDDYGYRSLRQNPIPPKGITKEQRAAIREEHKRLVGLWGEHCPPRLCAHKYWDQLGVNTGNLMLSGGIKFEVSGMAYFNLGFDINEADHLAKLAADKPSCGWIEGAVEITASEFEAARRVKLDSKEVASA